MKNNIKQLRKSEGLRQEDMAKILGVSRQTIIAIENDKYNPTLELAMKIAKNAPFAVRASKKAINEGIDTDMDRAIIIEEKLFGSCFTTEDQKVGMKAFLEKVKGVEYKNK